jgi:adenylate cyclase
MHPTDQAERHNPSRGRAIPRDVKRAVAHLRACLDSPITSAELARRCAVPERTLRKHFLAFLGHPPLAHLRRLRLAAARAALLDPAADATVTTVAARFHFAHLGRFSAEYRRRFGEPPSATLVRGRADAAETAPDRHPVRAGPADAHGEGGGLPSPAFRRRAPSLAVLPFRTDCGRPEERALAEALAEQLAAALSRMHGVAVRIARPAAVASGHTARELGARYCLTGRVARTPEGRLRVVARLLDLEAGGVHLWGDAYDGTTGDPFGLQDRVVAGVTGAVRPGIQEAEIERARRTPDRDLGARDLMLRALPLVLAADPASARRALGPLEAAMELDPDDPAPAALAGWCRAQLGLYWATPDPAAERARALHLVERAAALDAAGEPMVLTARSGVLMTMREREAADGLLARALAIAPDFAWAWERSAWVRANYGEAEAALGHFRRAVPLKGPRAPLANCMAGLGTAHLSAGRFEEAASWIRRALAENPGAVWLNRLLVPCYIGLGEREAARRALDRLRRAYPEVTVGHITGSLPAICVGRRREADGPVADGLSALGLPS